MNQFSVALLYNKWNHFRCSITHFPWPPQQQMLSGKLSTASLKQTNWCPCVCMLVILWDGYMSVYVHIRNNWWIPLNTLKCLQFGILESIRVDFEPSHKRQFIQFKAFINYRNKNQWHLWFLTHEIKKNTFHFYDKSNEKMWVNQRQRGLDDK